jgi:hypothetical protein
MKEDPMADTWPKTVRATFQPDVPLEVDEAEYTDLQRQGLLVDDGSATAAKLKAARAEKEGDK